MLLIGGSALGVGRWVLDPRNARGFGGCEESASLVVKDVRRTECHSAHIDFLFRNFSKFTACMLSFERCLSLHGKDSRQQS